MFRSLSFPKLVVLHWFCSVALTCSGHVPVIFVCNQFEIFACSAALVLRCSGHVPVVFRSCSGHVPVMLFLNGWQNMTCSRVLAISAPILGVNQFGVAPVSGVRT